MKKLATTKQSREQSIRREKVKELYIRGYSIARIAKQINAHYNTVASDVSLIKTNYLELAIKNPMLIQKQFAKVEELLDEVTQVKQEYWTVLEEIQTERKNKQKQYKEEYTEAVTEAKEKDKKKIKLKTAPRNFSTRLETLRAIMTRVDHEARLLNLYNTGTIIEKNYISMDTMKQIMIVFKGIIMDLIPKDKQNYAIRRMKVIDIKGISPDEVQSVQDAEIVEEIPEKKIIIEPEVVPKVKPVVKEEFNADEI